MQLTPEDYQLIINILNQTTVKISDAPVIQNLMSKLERLKSSLPVESEVIKPK